MGIHIYKIETSDLTFKKEYELLSLFILTKVSVSGQKRA